MNQKTKFPVNLPKTAFDMRAGLVQKEPIMIEKWEKQNIYKLRLEKRASAPKFIFHDGPPYANGDIHIGTALNKILKDIICRYKTMKGFQVPFTPGWDCHGLPIELNTLKALNKTADSLSTSELLGHCREYAQSFVEKQKNSFIRLGVSADWENPYLTMSNEYEATLIEAFGILVGKNYVYRGQRPIYWSPKTRTALADAEVEYHEHTSPTAYVLFPVSKHNIPNLPENTSVIIWTTTPWTLPSNVAVAFHPEASYEAVTLENGQTIILASELKHTVLGLTNATEQSSIALTKEQLESLTVQHAWINRESKVVFADYVTMDTGTGIVHTAPGHGTEDFQTGLKYNLEIISPVDDEGRFTAEVPEWEGMEVFEANPKILEFLKEQGKLYYTTNITHSYPHDWRTKTPVIFRTKPQWFFKVSDADLVAKTLAELPNIKWFPAWGEDRLKNMLSNRPDWCISRQRKWGVPIPAFYCEKCDTALVSQEIAFSIAEKVKTEGLDYWLKNDSETLLPAGSCCEKCGHNKFKKENDILDVWFDSGVSNYAVLKQQDNFPADLYLEGNDQYRGWFQSSLWNSMAINGKAPFKSIVTHGWVLDEHGRQMHKSAGNSVAPSEVTDKYGADILRLWIVTEDYMKDLRIGDGIIQKTIDLYRKLRNTFRYLLGTLGDFTEADKLSYAKLTSLDQHMLHRLAELKKSFDEHMENYQFHRAYREIFNFTIIDLSGEYFDILKDRLYILAPNDSKRRSAQTVLFHILEELTSMMAPVLVFTAEEVYEHAPFAKKEASVHLSDFVATPAEWTNETLNKNISTLKSIREESLKKLQELRDQGTIGSSLEGEITISCSAELFEQISPLKDTLTEMLIVSYVSIEKHDKAETTITAVPALRDARQKCERCWFIVDSIDENHVCPRCHDALEKF
ncbi:MAG: isoleucine--tRNA ligase [Brevinema sp.]